MLLFFLFSGSSSQCSQMDYSSTRSVFPRPRSPTPSSFSLRSSSILSPPIRQYLLQFLSIDVRISNDFPGRSGIFAISGRLSGQEGRPRRPSSRESPRRKNTGIGGRDGTAHFCFVLFFVLNRLLRLFTECSITTHSYYYSVEYSNSIAFFLSDDTKNVKRQK